MPVNITADLLAAAVAGYQAKLNEINQRMADLRRRIGAPAASVPATAGVPKRVLSPEGRARIVAAIRKRWAAVRRAKAVKVSPPSEPVVKAPVEAKPKTVKKPAKPAPAPKAVAKRAAPKQAVVKAKPTPAKKATTTKAAPKPAKTVSPAKPAPVKKVGVKKPAPQAPPATPETPST